MTSLAVANVDHARCRPDGFIAVFLQRWVLHKRNDADSLVVRILSVDRFQKVASRYKQVRCKAGDPVTGNNYQPDRIEIIAQLSDVSLEGGRNSDNTSHVIHYDKDNFPKTPFRLIASGSAVVTPQVKHRIPNAARVATPDIF